MGVYKGEGMEVYGIVRNIPFLFIFKNDVFTGGQYHSRQKNFHAICCDIEILCVFTNTHTHTDI